MAYNDIQWSIRLGLDSEVSSQRGELDMREL